MAAPGITKPLGRVMARFDVCNGDADGLCALRQRRLHDPSASV